MSTFKSGVLILFMVITFAYALTSQQSRMDEWTALDTSLRGVKSIVPKNGFVPDETTAIKIAEAVASAQYGEQVVAKEEPFRARLSGDIWTIKGTLHPAGIAGGTAVVRLRKADGRILLLIHQQ